MASSPPSAAAEKSGDNSLIGLLAGFVLLAASIFAYAHWVGPVAFMGDSYLFTDRSKHLFFLGNLDLNNHGSLIYPPLYSIVLAPCYALADAADVVTAIGLVNSLLIASALFPIHALLGRYAGLRGGERWFFSILLTASPTFVCYAPMVLSEAFFIPLVYWMTYGLFRSLSDQSPRWFAFTALFLAAALLSRSAATTLLLSGFGAWGLHLFLARGTGWKRNAAGLGIALLALAVPLLLWRWFEQNHVTYQGGVGYSIGASLRALLDNPADQAIKLEWTANAIAYFLTSPLSLAPALVLVIAVSRPLDTMRDPLAPFVGATVALAIASIVVLAPTSYGGGPLTWNKYFAPYVGLVSIVALRLRPQAGPKLLSAAIVVPCLLALLGRPAGLACHFPDALTPFINSALPLPVAAPVRNLLFCVLLAGTAPLMMPAAKRRAWLLGAGVAASLVLLALGASARYWRNSGWLNFAGYQGVATRLAAITRAEPATKIYYDPDITYGDHGEGLRTLFYFPRLIPALPRAELFTPTRALPSRFLYLTRGMLPDAEVVASEGESLRLLRLDQQKVRESFAYQLEYGRDVGGQEAIPFDGKPSMVRWLGPKPEFSFQLDQAVPHARLGLRLAAAGGRRTVSATLNGQRLPEQPTITHVLWQGGYDYVEWSVPLGTGRNTLVLESDAAPIVLPDGARTVTLMLIDEPVVSIARP